MKKRLQAISKSIAQLWLFDEKSSGRWGAKRLAPTFSNRPDCRRFGCPETPWHWANRWALERAKLTGKEIVADLGSGANPLALPLYQQRTKQVYLLDYLILPSQNLSPHLKPIMADISDLPLPNESVDVVISTSVLEHLPVANRLTAMREAARILKPGGRAILTVGLPLQASAEAQALMGSLPFFLDRGCPLYFPIDIKQMLEVVPSLHFVAFDKDQFLPGYEGYNEQLLLNNPNLVMESWDTYSAIAAYPDLMRVSHCEIGLVLEKQKN